MDGELPRVYSEEIPQAHKKHICCECQRTIDIGQQYHLFKGNWEGRWQTFKTCILCNDLRHELSDHGEWPPFGNLSEWAHEAGEVFPPESIPCD